MKTEFQNYASGINDCKKLNELKKFIIEHGGIIDIREARVDYLMIGLRERDNETFADVGKVLGVCVFNDKVYVCVYFGHREFAETIEELRYSDMWHQLDGDEYTLHFNLVEILNVIEEFI